MDKAFSAVCSLRRCLVSGSADGQSVLCYPPNGGNADYNGGVNTYTLYATANPGFAFVGWSVTISGHILATNNPWTVSLTNATLPSFALFASVTPPTVKITRPTRGQKLHRAQAAIRGQASDFGVVSAVYYGVAASPQGPFTWFPATSENGFKTWKAKALLLDGTNILAAYAVDNIGVPSTTNFVSFQNRSTGFPAALTGLAAQVTPRRGRPSLSVFFRLRNIRPRILRYQPSCRHRRLRL